MPAEPGLRLRPGFGVGLAHKAHINSPLTNRMLPCLSPGGNSLLPRGGAKMHAEVSISETRVAQVAQLDGIHWGGTTADAYFDDAEQAMEQTWTQLIGPILEKVQFEIALDIAAGRGRNSVRLADKAKRVICLDINPDNIEHMRRRFDGGSRFSFVQNDGMTLRGIADKSVDLAYSFNSMVHFDMEVVISYVNECFRVLRPGGHAFIHHSNYTDNPGGDFRTNPHWRNFMSLTLFRHLALKAGFTIVLSQSLFWGGIADLDGIALLQKPQ